jgi:hypothetical protein
MSDKKECCGGTSSASTTTCCQNLEVLNEDANSSVELTPEQEEELEKRFFLLYHMRVQCSEYNKMTPLQRDWTIQRFIHQKKMEKEIASKQQNRSGILVPEISLEF